MATSSSLLAFKACLSRHNTEALTLRHYSLTRKLEAKIRVVGSKVFHLIVSVFVRDLRLHLGLTVYDILDSARRIVSQLWHLVNIIGKVGTTSIDTAEVAGVRHLSISTILVLFSLLFLLSNQRK